MTRFRRGLIKWARTVHLYVTLFTLGLILFFSVTGFLLNHEDWLGTDNPHSITRTGNVPPESLVSPDKLSIVELLRKDYGAVGAVDSFEIEEDRIRVVFKKPGTRIDASIIREDGQVEVLSETRGFVGLLLDLHRGKSTGIAWSLVIDIVCIAMMLIAMTGLILWWSLKGRGKYGIAVIAIGCLISIAIYFAYVP